MNIIRRYQNLTPYQRLARGLGLFIFFGFVIPAAITYSHLSEATVTIITDKDLPIEFALDDNQGFPDGPLQLDCRIVVKNGTGRFVTGSIGTMNSYGFPPTPWTIASRRVAVEHIDKHGKLLSREVSRESHVFCLSALDFPNVLSGQRFSLRNLESP
jgi:hypothetical protein